jgi:hypothetical protein
MNRRRQYPILAAILLIQREAMVGRAQPRVRDEVEGEGTCSKVKGKERKGIHKTVVCRV